MQQTITTRPENQQRPLPANKGSLKLVEPVLRVMLLLIGAVFWSLVLPHPAVAEKETVKLEYPDNSGFMQDVPAKLRKELPMCDKFLDVKWIRKMPHGNWVGRVVVDVRNNGKKEKRELAVAEKYKKSSHGHLKIFDITATEYHQSEFDRLILSADVVVSELAWQSDVVEIGLGIIKGEKKIILCYGEMGRQKDMDRGVASGWIRYLKKKICIVPPEKNRWLFGKNRFIFENKEDSYGN